jgi:multicomponent Na+:H+ antiporter subunit D
MKPHEEISVDFDWFYRKPFNTLILWISHVLENIFAWCSLHSARGADYLRAHFGDPTLWTRNSRSVRIRNFSFENENRLVGDIVTAIVTVLVAMLIIAAIAVH